MNTKLKRDQGSIKDLKEKVAALIIAISDA